MDDYLKQHEIMHTKNNVFVGNSLLRYNEVLKGVVSEHKPKILLDYGCGKGLQYTMSMAHKDWGMDYCPVLYDPCYPPFSNKPEGEFDGVICTDVLEHIPRENLAEIIKDIFSYTSGFVFFGVSIKPAKKSLPNGNNAHSTIKPISWWNYKIDKFNSKNIKVYLYYEDVDNPNLIKSF